VFKLRLVTDNEDRGSAVDEPMHKSTHILPRRIRPKDILYRDRQLEGLRDDLRRRPRSRRWARQHRHRRTFRQLASLPQLCGDELRLSKSLLRQRAIEVSPRWRLAFGFSVPKQHEPHRQVLLPVKSGPVHERFLKSRIVPCLVANGQCSICVITRLRNTKSGSTALAIRCL